MAIKSVSIRIEEEMLEKIGYIADYEGRSVDSHVLVLIRENIKRPALFRSKVLLQDKINK